MLGVKSLLPSLLAPNPTSPKASDGRTKGERQPDLTSLPPLASMPLLVVPNTEGEYRVGDLVLSGHILDNMTLVGRSQGSAKVLPCTGPAVMLDTSHPTEEKPTLCHKGQRLKRKWFKQ